MKPYDAAAEEDQLRHAFFFSLVVDIDENRPNRGGGTSFAQ